MGQKISHAVFSGSVGEPHTLCSRLDSVNRRLQFWSHAVLGRTGRHQCRNLRDGNRPQARGRISDVRADLINITQEQESVSVERTSDGPSRRIGIAIDSLPRIVIGDRRDDGNKPSTPQMLNQGDVNSWLRGHPLQWPTNRLGGQGSAVNARDAYGWYAVLAKARHQFAVHVRQRHVDVLHDRWRRHAQPIDEGARFTHEFKKGRNSGSAAVNHDNMSPFARKRHNVLGKRGQCGTLSGQVNESVAADFDDVGCQGVTPVRGKPAVSSKPLTTFHA